MLHRLAWSSVPSAHFSEARINEIIAPARRANARNHISGMLIFTGAHFVSIDNRAPWRTEPASYLAADRYHLVPLPSDVYLLSHVPFAIHPAEVAAVAVFALATALLAAVMPARAAARLAPGEAIRLSR